METFEVNGFKVFYHRMDSPIVNIRAIVNAGSYQETFDKWGVAHYLEHMFFKGTEKKDYKEINKITSRLGNTNAYTDYDKTVFYINTLADTKSFTEAFGILAEMMYEPRFDKAEFEKERGVILEEIKGRNDNPGCFFFDSCFRAFEGELGHSITGYEMDIKSHTLDKLMDFRNKYYGDVIWTICGGIDEAEALDIAEKVLGKYPRAREVDVDKVYEFKPGFMETKIVHASEQAWASLCFVGDSNPQIIEDRRIFSLTDNIIGGGMHSLMFDRLREELGLCYSTFVGTNICLDHSSIILTCALDKKNVGLLRSEMMNIIDGLINRGVSEELIDVSKSNYLFGVANNLSSVSGFAGYQFDNWYVRGQKFVDFEDVKADMEALTNEDIKAYAKRIFGQPYMFCSMTN